MVDAFVERRSVSSNDGVSPTLVRLTLLWLIIVLGLLLTTPLVRAAIEIMVRAAAAGQVNLVSNLASDVRTASPSVYIQKYFVGYLGFRLALILFLTLGLLALWRRKPPVVAALGTIAPAAIVLGFNTSIRILGPFAALIVAAYAVYRLRRGSWPVLLAYAVLAFFTMYLTWPYLWPDPLGHLVESAVVMSRYPWSGTVLFGGQLYPSTGLPPSYLPVLLAIQFTETAWLAILTGIVIAALQLVRHGRAAGSALLLSVVWCALPVLGFVLTRSPLYDNFRQVLLYFRRSSCSPGWPLRRFGICASDWRSSRWPFCRGSSPALNCIHTNTSTTTGWWRRPRRLPQVRTGLLGHVYRQAAVSRPRSPRPTQLFGLKAPRTCCNYMPGRISRSTPPTNPRAWTDTITWWPCLALTWISAPIRRRPSFTSFSVTAPPSR